MFFCSPYYFQSTREPSDINPPKHYLVWMLSSPLGWVAVLSSGLTSYSSTLKALKARRTKRGALLGTSTSSLQNFICPLATGELTAVLSWPSCSQLNCPNGVCSLLLSCLDKGAWHCVEQQQMLISVTPCWESRGYSRILQSKGSTWAPVAALQRGRWRREERALQEGEGNHNWPPSDKPMFLGPIC